METFSASSVRAVDILADLISFDTTSSNSNLALIGYIESHLAKLGVESKRIWDDAEEKANLFAAIGPAGPHGVILSGHTDVVPVQGQQWTSDPFVMTARGDRLYGRGTADMKAFIACSLAALEFADLAALQRPVYLAFSYDEEIGCLGAPRLIEHIRSNIALPAVAVIGEPTSMGVVGSHKSVHIYNVGIVGIPAHSSAVHQGLSANTLGIRLMNILIQIADRLASPEHHNDDFTPPFSTLTIGLMQGGTAVNILAADASFAFDLRCLPEHDADEILAPFYDEVEKIRLSHPDAVIVIEPKAMVPSLARVSGGEAEALVRKIGGDNADMTTVSYGAEAGQFQRAGFSTILCGPGSMEQGHQPDEFIEVREIEKCMRFMARLFTEMSHPAAEALS
ncbi:hypothetical protein ASE00_01520 [Sphingomonas sp. Root710]|nr:hypothetical protein ASE00_01520 [Sphingomonas sp. Root710]